MEFEQRQLGKAVQAAQMYYYQNLPMKQIASELNVSHSTISRLLEWARQQGLVEIRINDPRGRSSPLVQLIKLHFKLKNVQIVPVSEMAGESVWHDRVTRVAASYLNRFMESDLVLGVAWGKTINSVINNLTPKTLFNSHIVQLNGGENISGTAISHANELMTLCANNYNARVHLFPVPSYFDFAETKEAMWRERSVRRILEMQNRSDIILFSIGSYLGPNVSAAYMGDYLTKQDYEQMEAYGVVGDIANVMIREDGTYDGIPMNERACGPELSLFHNANRSICVVSGSNKIPGLKAALKARYLTDLIIDEPSARKLVESIQHD